MKNSQLSVKHSDKAIDISGSLPTIKPDTGASSTDPSALAAPQESATAGPATSAGVGRAQKMDSSLDIALSSNLRDHTATISAPQSVTKPRIFENASPVPSQDVFTRFVTWVASLIKKLERRLIQRLEGLPVLVKILPRKLSEEEELRKEESES